MNKRKVFRFVLVAFHILCLALLAGTACGPSGDEKLSGEWEFSGGINGSPKLSLLENCDYKIFRYSADFSKTIYLDRGKWVLCFWKTGTDNSETRCCLSAPQFVKRRH